MKDTTAVHSSPVGTALVGLGHVAGLHADALASLPESRFVGVFDARAERTARFAADYHVHPYTCLKELLSDASVDAAVVTTPHRTHAEVAIKLVNSGRHVLVEKPMATSLSECDAMILAAEKSGVLLSVVSQRRWYEPVRRVKDAIDGGRIGHPLLGTLNLLGWRGADYYAMDAWRGTWAGEGGGVLVNQAAHQLDLFQWFMGPIASVDAYAANLSHPTIEVEDTTVAIVRFASGALGSIVASNCQSPGLYGRLHVHGDNGASIGVQTDTGSAPVGGVTAFVQPPFNDLWTVPGEEAALARWQRSDRRRSGANLMARYHRLQVEDFLNAILHGGELGVSGHDGRKAVELFIAIYRAQRRGGPVCFPVLPDPSDGVPLSASQAH